jgi:hypothetical protein
LAVLDGKIRLAILESTTSEVNRARQVLSQASAGSEAKKDAGFMVASALLKAALLTWSQGINLAGAMALVDESYDLFMQTLGRSHKFTAYAIAMKGGIFLQTLGYTDKKGQKTVYRTFKEAADILEAVSKDRKDGKSEPGLGSVLVSAWNKDDDLCP